MLSSRCELLIGERSSYPTYLHWSKIFDFLPCFSGDLWLFHLCGLRNTTTKDVFFFFLLISGPAHPPGGSLPPPSTGLHRFAWILPDFLPAAKPTGPRTVRVFVVLFQGSSLVVNSAYSDFRRLSLRWNPSLPDQISLWGGIYHSLNRFLFWVASVALELIIFLPPVLVAQKISHVQFLSSFDAAGLWTKSVIVHFFAKRQEGNMSSQKKSPASSLFLQPKPGMKGRGGMPNLILCSLPFFLAISGYRPHPPSSYGLLPLEWDQWRRSANFLF